MRRLTTAACTLLFLCACPALRSYRAAEYYPLKKDAVWTYRITTYEHDPKGESMVRTARVVDEANGEFRLSQGENTFTYVRTPDGIMKAKSRNFLIREPVEKGATWKVDVSGGDMALAGTAQVAEKGVEVKVGTVAYRDCVVVDEVYQGLQRNASTYCPGVGMVRLEVFEISRGGERLIHKAELLAYQGVEEVKP